MTHYPSTLPLRPVPGLRPRRAAAPDGHVALVDLDEAVQQLEVELMEGLDFRPDVIGDLRDEPEPALPRAEYQEDDWIAEVVILAELGDGKREAYHLEVVRTIESSALYRPVPDGTRFYCDQPRCSPGLVFTLMRL